MMSNRLRKDRRQPSARLWLWLLLLLPLLWRPAGLPASAATTATFPMLADFEDGVPAGWFQYSDGGVSTVNVSVPTIADSDPDALPGQVGDNNVLAVDATVPTWGGFGAGLVPAQDWGDYDALAFWFYGEASATVHEIEIQTAGAGNHRATFVDDRAGWRPVILPFNQFGAGNFDLSAITNWVFVLDGTIGDLKLDNLQLVNLLPFADFEGGVPAGWFQYSDGGVSTVGVNVMTVADSDPDALPNQVGNNDVLAIDANVPTWGGFGAGFVPPVDWSDMQGVSFWFQGSASATVHEVEIQTAAAGNHRATFSDDVAGWTRIVLPFTSFGSGNFDLSQITNWVFVLDGTVGQLKLDDMAVYGDAGNITLKVAFESASTTVIEGETAAVTVTLNTTATVPVTVTVQSADVSATAGSDYTTVNTPVVIAAGATTAVVQVETLDDSDSETLEELTLSLSDPQGAQLGPVATTSVKILDNDQSVVVTGKVDVFDDMEMEALPSGFEGGAGGAAVGFVTWSDGSPIGLDLTTVGNGDPLARPGQSGDNTLLKVTHTIGGWGGFTHAFENATVDDWVTQNWSNHTGVSLWFYGNGTGQTIQFDLFDNRGTTDSDSAERWYYRFTDDALGWQYVEMPFSEFQRRTDFQPGGAPDDGLNLTEVHGYAIGFPPDGGVERVNYIDNVALMVRVDVVDDMEYETLPTGFEGGPAGPAIGFATWSDGSAIGLDLATVGSGDPLARPGQGENNTLLKVTHTIGGWGGFTHAFENETVDDWVTQNWSSYLGVCFWFYGNGTGSTFQFDLFDNRGTTDTDSAERWYYRFTDDTLGWKLVTAPFSEFQRRTDFQPGGAPDDGLNLIEVHGYALGFPPDGGVERVNYIDDVAVYGNTAGQQLPLQARFADRVSVTEGETAAISITLTVSSTEIVTVSYQIGESYAIPGRDFDASSGQLVFAPGETFKTFDIVTYDDAKPEADERIVLTITDAQGGGVEVGTPFRSTLTILDNDDAEPLLLSDNENGQPYLFIDGNVTTTSTELAEDDPLALPNQQGYEMVASATYDGAASFTSIFPQSADWSGFAGMTFWYYGAGQGDTVTLELLDNQTVTTAASDPADWSLVWSDEFNDPAGTRPNPDVWMSEIGDGTLNGIPGWGNGEFQYYTDAAENASTDGSGNLLITLRAADGSLQCWYGPCEYTSARLLTKDRLNFQYGRIEARMQVPSGGDGNPNNDDFPFDQGDGVWPAFWMLGDDIDEVGWPQTGEIDIMEIVTREPFELFGTIHGPGYSGGQSFGGTIIDDEPYFTDYHVYGVEWEPNIIRWYVDGELYHTAEPGDVAPNEWVFEHPFFLLQNMAIGGNFGGEIGDNVGMPQELRVDYVRVYQTANNSERFGYSFTDDVAGWRQINVAFADMQRLAEQPAGAPNDGLGLSEVWGYGFRVEPAAADRAPATVHIDQVRLALSDPTSVALNGATGRDVSVAVGSVTLALLVALAAFWLLLGRRATRTRI